MSGPLHRILYVTPTGAMGGGEVSLLTLLRHLDRSLYTPLVCAFADGRFVEALRGEGHDVVIVPRRAGRLQLGTVWRLAKLIEAHDIDLVHTNILDLRAALAARLSGRPIVAHLRVIYPFSRVDRLASRLSDRVICVSKAVRDRFADAPGPRFRVIYNPIDAPAVGAVDLRSELGLGRDAVVVGAVGRIDPWKGFEVFIEAAASIDDGHDVHFVLAGAPSEAIPSQVAYDARLRSQVRTLGLEGRFHFLGHRTDALSLIAQLTVLVVPSLVLGDGDAAWAEGFGRVAAEGLAVGTPVIASRSGGLEEIVVPGESGLLVPTGDGNALRDAIRDLLASPTDRARFSENGQARWREMFSGPVHADQVQGLYQDVLRGRE